MIMKVSYVLVFCFGFGEGGWCLVGSHVRGWGGTQVRERD